MNLFFPLPFPLSRAGWDTILVQFLLNASRRGHDRTALGALQPSSPLPSPVDRPFRRRSGVRDASRGGDQAVARRWIGHRPRFGLRRCLVWILAIFTCDRHSSKRVGSIWRNVLEPFLLELCLPQLHRCLVSCSLPFGKSADFSRPRVEAARRYCTRRVRDRCSKPIVQTRELLSLRGGWSGNPYG